MCSNKIVRLADMPLNWVVRLFAELNRGKIVIVSDNSGAVTIIANVDPKYLAFPEGWYFVSGSFTNRYNTTQGYSSARVLDSSGKPWAGAAGCLPD